MRAEFRAGPLTLEVGEDWSLVFKNQGHSYGPIRDVDLLPQVPAIAESLGASPKEVLGLLLEYEGWAKPRVRPLYFEVDEAQITFNADEGVRVPASRLYHRERDSLLVGELTYAYAEIVKAPSSPSADPKCYEAVEPLLIWTHLKGGTCLERMARPHRMAGRLMVDGQPIKVELKAQYTGTLDTLMSLEAVEKFLDGAEPPSWAEAYKQVRGSLEGFVSFPWDPRLYDVVSCWVLGTYFSELFSAYPFLYIYGSQGSGKSRLMLTAVYLSRHGFVATDPSDASLYRAAEAFRPTLGIDESLLGREAWKLIRTAFKRGLRVPRVEKTRREEFTLALYETYMPVAFASTERPTELGGCEADEARSLFIFMQQAQDPAGRDPEPQDFSELRDRLYHLRLLRAHEVLEALELVRGSGLPLQGHEWEVWLPVLTVARLAGDEVYRNVLGYAGELIAIKNLFQYQEERLLIAAMERLLEASPKLPGAEPMAEFRPRDLLEHVMAELEERGEYQEARFLRYWSPERVGRVLTRMSVFKRELARGTYYTITEKGLRLLKSRYEVNAARFSGSSGSCGSSGGIFENTCPSETPVSTRPSRGEGETEIKSPLKEAENLKEPLKSPQKDRVEIGENSGETPKIGHNSGTPSFKNTATTATTATKPDEGFISPSPCEEVTLNMVGLEGLRGLKARYEPNTQASVGSVCSVGIFEGVSPSPTPRSTAPLISDGEGVNESPRMEAEIQKDSIKMPSEEGAAEAEMEAPRTDETDIPDGPLPERSYTTYTTYTKPYMRPLNQNEALEGPLPKKESLKIPLSQVEELILRVVGEEGSIGILLLKQRAEARLGRRLEGEEYQSTLRSLDHKGLIRLTGEAVSIRKIQMAPQETLAQALERLGALPPGAEFSPEELSSRFGWPVDYVERVLRVAEREGIVFQNPSGGWRRG